MERYLTSTFHTAVVAVVAKAWVACEPRRISGRRFFPLYSGELGFPGEDKRLPEIRLRLQAKARVNRRASQVPNLTLMSKIYCYCSFAL